LTTSTYRPAYNLVRDMVSEHGGTMVYIKKGEGADGTWFVQVAGKRTYFPVKDRRCPGIDELHVRKPGLITNTWDDFLNELLPNAWDLLLENMKYPVFHSSDPDSAFDDLLEL